MSEGKSYPLDIFMERYASFTDDLTTMEQNIEKLNRIYARENFCIDQHGNLVVKGDVTQRICNFFVYPTHKLYFDHGNFIELEGVAVVAYTKHEEKYKKVYLNLTNDLIESGSWVRSEYLDTEYDLMKASQYFYLRSALKIATRRIGTNDVMIFDGEDWVEDEEAAGLLKEYQSYIKNRRIWDKVKNIDSLQNTIGDYLKAMQTYITGNQLTTHGNEPIDENTNKGWENDEFYFLWGKEFWKWMETRFASKDMTFDKDRFIDYLVEQNVIEVETEKRGRIRVEVWETVYPKFKKRFLKINRAKLEHLLK
ncbi:hypothetical protein B5M42_012975 [Paenibacillus athensensis]|uniref:Uncharacterized protein n=1 Tax=Paenibacillus athensensis TaxID=1967502 RepID=A0A4Y8Q8F7_9BACL|nr:hypothetical protein [Paenibacillus athensensis]MCD1259747.1 hypothetical protein [Paenibacillus athensensis]